MTPVGNECSSGLQSIRLTLLAIILLVVASLSHGQTGIAATDSQVNVAGLIIDYGDGAITYALIPFTEESLSGLDLLNRSGLDLLSIEIGGMGTAVCAIEQVGCEYDACRGRLCQTGEPDSPYWQYLRGTEFSGEDWRYSSQGVGRSTLTDGAVDGWFWSSHRPANPGLTVEEIADTMQIDLDELRESPQSKPIVLTVGSIQPTFGTPEVDRWQMLGGAAVLTSVGGFGWLAIRRSQSLKAIT